MPNLENFAGKASGNCFAFDFPTITATQQLANLCFELLQKSSQIHPDGCSVAFHDLPESDVLDVQLPGFDKRTTELHMEAIDPYPAKSFTVTTLSYRFDSLHLCEIKFFSKHYETH